MKPPNFNQGGLPSNRAASGPSPDAQDAPGGPVLRVIHGDDSVDLSVVIPVYNSAQIMPSLLARLRTVLGGLDLTLPGLKRRDELVFRVAKAQNIPVMVTYAGGYAVKVEDTVTIHCNTVIAAKEVFR